LSILAGSQAACPQREMIQHHRKRIRTAESAVLTNPTEANLAELKEALEASRKWRESLG
jgi:hypothetical protein